jgi:hypothetical protein
VLATNQNNAKRMDKVNDKEKKARATNAGRADAHAAGAIRRRSTRGIGETADWSTADATKLHHAIENVTAAGCAIQFGYTRDGGAYSIRIVGDGEPYTEYVRPTEDLDHYLEGVALDFQK